MDLWQDDFQRRTQAEKVRLRQDAELKALIEAQRLLLLKVETETAAAIDPSVPYELSLSDRILLIGIGISPQE